MGPLHYTQETRSLVCFLSYFAIVSTTLMLFHELNKCNTNVGLLAACRGHDNASEWFRAKSMSLCVVEGEGPAVGEAVMATWLEHVWFRHVPPTNFLLADSYHIHTAQQTQKILLEVKNG